jgi:uncharacterized protein (DUF3084 family)
VARALLDLKLEHSQAMEKAEAEGYSVSSELLVVRAELADAEARGEELEASAAVARKEAEESAAARKDMEEQLHQAQRELKEAIAGLEREDAKGIELGAELLTLINARTHLEVSNAELESKVKVLQARAEKAESEIQPAQEALQVSDDIPALPSRPAPPAVRRWPQEHSPTPPFHPHPSTESAPGNLGCKPARRCP